MTNKELKDFIDGARLSMELYEELGEEGFAHHMKGKVTIKDFKKNGMATVVEALEKASDEQVIKYQDELEEIIKFYFGLWLDHFRDGLDK